MKLFTAQTMLAVGLVAGIVGTGITLVATIHESRSLFQELEALKREQDRLDDDWSALQLEVGTLAGHARIEEIARKELGFIEPDERLVFVKAER